VSGGGSKNQTITQTSEPPAYAAPWFQSALNQAGNITGQSYVPYTGQLVSGMTPDQTAAMDMVRQRATNPSLSDYGSNYAAGILGGQGQYQGGTNPFLGMQTATRNNPNPLIAGLGSGGPSFTAQTSLGSNPYAGKNQYLEDMVSASTRGVTDNFSKATMPSLLSQFQQGGAFGGTAMQNQMDSAQNTLAQNLGEIESGIRFNDYTTQQQLAEAGLNRSLAAQQGDNQINAQMANSAADRQLQGGIAAANLWDQGANRTLQAQLADLSRNSGLAENALNRDLQAWGQYQGNQLGALGMTPGLDQAGYFGANQLGQQGLQQQGLNQTWLDANYRQFLDARDWDMNRLNPLLQALSAVQGGTVSGTNPNGSSPLAGALGGGLAGASLAGMLGGAGGGAAAGAGSGAATGSAVGPWGTAIGAGVGALAGWLGSR